MDKPVSQESAPNSAVSPPAITELKQRLAEFRRPSTIYSLVQATLALCMFIGGLIGTGIALQSSWLMAALIALPTAGIFVRLFIIQHDCGHGSYFTSKKMNDSLGRLISLFTLTPYTYWQKAHAIHHGNTGNLDQRGVGDIFTLTVNEYRELPAFERFRYRLYRNPLILFGVAPTFLFLVLQRLPGYSHPSLKKYESSVLLSNLCMGVFFGGIMAIVGWKSVLAVYLPIIALASSAGVWLFYVQHQYEHAWWVHGEEWNHVDAALRGSSFYKLPAVLQWFTGNIGYHHVHHLHPGIPNYRLEDCHRTIPELQNTVTISLSESFRLVKLALWDEAAGRMVGFGAARRPAGSM